MEEWLTWLRSQPLLSYLIILIMTAIVYKVAFARELPILKSVLVYLVLAVGCVMFWVMFILRFPIIQILGVTLIMILLARIRMWMGNREKKADQ
ncbi:Ca2+/Na+ antiporter [Kroppenstedtia sanguinis]|uniref:YlaH-like family protein n=1 Tax=Kroppenstedtia sanguinis TaxID=1380684 RepID=A0ABW4C7P8_9BACL